YFEPGLFTLFPEWPVYRTAQIFWLLAVTAAVRLLPKGLATILALTDSKLQKGFGGAVTLLNGVFAEQLVSMLIAPAMMLFHSTFIFAALSGRQIGWTKYPRGDRRVGLAESMDRHAWHIALAAIWGGTVLVL